MDGNLRKEMEKFRDSILNKICECSEMEKIAVKNKDVYSQVQNSAKIKILCNTLNDMNYLLKQKYMKIVKMKIGFWLIPEFHWTKDNKYMFFLTWKFIFKSTLSTFDKPIKKDQDEQ